MTRSTRFHSWPICAAALTLVLGGCSADPTRGVSVPAAPQFGKVTSTPTVASTNPTDGERGQRLLVHVLGSGYNASAQATWERNGVVDPRVTVLSTTFVSSSEVVADVQIASDADIDLYDVAVSVLATDGGRKKGVGIELFAVTTASFVSGVSDGGRGTNLARGINDAGQIVGGGFGRGDGYFWDPITGVDDLGPGSAYDLTASGTMIVGNYNDGTLHYPQVWTGGPGHWTVSPLATGCVSNADFGAREVSPDGTLIGGGATISLPKNTTQKIPVVWDGPTAPCRRLGFPGGASGSGWVYEVSAIKTIAGSVTINGVTSAVVWDSEGVPTVLAAAPGGTYSEARGINPSGTIAVGLSNSGGAVFWVRSGTTWSAPISLPCGSWAVAANDYGEILGKGCDGGLWWRVSGTSVVASGSMPGLVPSDPHPNPEVITNNTVSGQPWAAGGTNAAVIWRRP